MWIAPLPDTQGCILKPPVCVCVCVCGCGAALIHLPLPDSSFVAPTGHHTSHPPTPHNVVGWVNQDGGRGGDAGPQPEAKIYVEDNKGSAGGDGEGEAAEEEEAAEMEEAEEAEEADGSESSRRQPSGTNVAAVHILRDLFRLPPWVPVSLDDGLAHLFCHMPRRGPRPPPPQKGSSLWQYFSTAPAPKRHGF